MDKDTPSNGELYRQNAEFKKELKDYILESAAWRTHMSEMVGAIDKKVAVANGRTGDHDKAILLLGDNFAKINGTIVDMKGDRKWVLGAAAVVIFFWGVLALFLRLYIEDIARNVVAETLSDYDQIIIENK